MGTHVFTAMERTNGGADIRWAVVSLKRGGRNGGAHGGQGGDVEPIPADPGGARTALDRIVIPQDVLDRIAGMGPRSSLIVTDEAPSSETGNGTDFVVLMSGEPQGGIKFRRGPGSAARDRLPYAHSPSADQWSTW
jgi:hypothetical protein